MKSKISDFKPSEQSLTLLDRAVIDPETRAEFPLVLHNAPAGFPSPADDYIENTLDLNEYLIDNPVATFMMRVTGNSMVVAGIRDKDVIIVDRSKEPLAVGRKNWLFAGSPKGARASAIYFSLTETAKANVLEPHAYIRHLFEMIPMAETEKDLKRLLPKNFTRETLPLYS
jgi:hypothetical protein